MTSGMILAAGFGTRLHPVTNWFPKPLVPIGDAPAFRHILNQLRDADVTPVVMNAHHRAEAFTGQLPNDILLSVEEEILGTAGGVRFAEALLGAGNVLVWNGDIFALVDIATITQSHALHPGVIATMLVAPSPRKSGTVGISKSGEVVRLRGQVHGEETLSGNYMGVLLIDASARDSLPKHGCLVGDWMLPLLAKGARVNVVWHHSWWIDIGTPSALVQANMRWLAERGLDRWISPNAHVAQDVMVRKAVVCAGSKVMGDAGLERCLVLPNSGTVTPIDSGIVLPNGQLLPIATEFFSE